MQREPGPNTYRPFPFSRNPGISTGDCLEEPVFPEEMNPHGLVKKHPRLRTGKKDP